MLVCAFGDTTKVKEGDIAKRTGKVVEVPVGKEMLGRVETLLVNR